MLGQGYLSANRLGQIIGFSHAGMTAEGDNRVLMQKVTKEVMDFARRGKRLCEPLTRRFQPSQLSLAFFRYQANLSWLPSPMLLIPASPLRRLSLTFELCVVFSPRESSLRSLLSPPRCRYRSLGILGCQYVRSLCSCSATCVNTEKAQGWQAALRCVDE